ncbi:hypothetical protein C8E97_0395 [Saccharothrix australiensis]|uniref:Uncharacterized protein n=1 Tax=Saccharothrix australiensis TaxID=2072 RepID=A0A495VU05_9PSEU|nr:hypothetical protein C8E97_0395 [Saccharothrix australiensis]
MGGAGGLRTKARTRRPPQRGSRRSLGAPSANLPRASGRNPRRPVGEPPAGFPAESAAALSEPSAAARKRRCPVGQWKPGAGGHARTPSPDAADRTQPHPADRTPTSAPTTVRPTRCRPDTDRLRHPPTPAGPSVRPGHRSWPTRRADVPACGASPTCRIVVPRRRAGQTHRVAALRRGARSRCPVEVPGRSTASMCWAEASGRKRLRRSAAVGRRASEVCRGMAPARDPAWPPARDSAVIRRGLRPPIPLSQCAPTYPGGC